MQTIPNLSSSKSEFEVPLLVSAYRKNNTASAQVKDKEDHFTSGAFDSLQEMQQK
jgi:hypothetical protein